MLIYAPVGSTGEMIYRTLESAGIPSRACESLEELASETERGAGGLVLIEEAIASPADLETLTGALESQPEGYDAPVTVFSTSPEPPSPVLRRLLEITAGRSVSIFSRPIHPLRLVSIVQDAFDRHLVRRKLHDDLSEGAEALRKAEQAGRLRSTMLATVSHELKTPLNAIIGHSHLLAEEIAGPVSREQRAHIARIEKTAWQLLELIDEVLAWSRLEAGKAELAVASVEIGPVVRGVVELLRPEAESRGLALGCHGPGMDARIETDEGKLRQILLNLVSNAVKFTDAGEVEVRVEGLEDEALTLHVRDTGTGIPPEDLEKIFEPYTQVGRSERRRDGTGLGLEVVRRLSGLLGARISVESEVGRGTTFTLVFPERVPPPGA